MGRFLIFALTFMLSAQQNAIGEQVIDSCDTYNGYKLPGNLENLSGINPDHGFSGYPLTVPFHSNISGGLKPKMTLIIRGLVKENAISFRIDFVAGHSIALHLNPRLVEEVVVRNSFLTDKWETEERYLDFNPFQRGKFFELSITCGKNQFIVYANDEFLFSYKHRYHDLHRINNLMIKGDLVLYHVHY